MSSSATDRRLATAISMGFHDTGFTVALSDGRTLHFDYDDFDFLRDATPEQRGHGVVDENGTALWWDELLEGISVAGLIGVSESELEEFAGLCR